MRQFVLLALVILFALSLTGVAAQALPPVGSAAANTKTVSQYCTAGFSYVPDAGCCCGPDCLQSRCGSGNGPNGECCAPEGVVPAAAYDRSPNAERQAYNPVIVETTLVIGPDGKETVASKKIVQGGRKPPSVRQLSSGVGSTPDAAAVQRQQRHLQRKPNAAAGKPTPAPTTAAPVATPGPRTRKLGIYVEESNDQLNQREVDFGFRASPGDTAGDKFDYQLKFQNVNYLDITEASTIVNAGRDYILTMEFFPLNANGAQVYLGNIYEQLLGKKSDGAEAYYFDLLDTYAQQLAGFTASTGRTVKLRIFHEVNGDWYPWGLLNNVFYSKGSFEARLAGEFDTALQLYKDAYAYVIGIFEAHGASIDWQVVINNNNGRGDTSVPRDKFVPTNVIDKIKQIGMGGYNAYTSPDYDDSFTTVFSACYSQLRGFNLPMFISETSTDDRNLRFSTPGGTTTSLQRKALWFQDAFAVYAKGNTFPLVRELTWFLLDKYDGGTLRNYDTSINDGITRPGFKKGFLDNRVLLSATA